MRTKKDTSHHHKRNVFPKGSLMHKKRCHFPRDSNKVQKTNESHNIVVSNSNASPVAYMNKKSKKFSNVVKIK